MIKPELASAPEISNACFGYGDLVNARGYDGDSCPCSDLWRQRSILPGEMGLGRDALYRVLL